MVALRRVTPHFIARVKRSESHKRSLSEEAIDVIHKWLPIHYSFVLV